MTQLTTQGHWDRQAKYLEQLRAELTQMQLDANDVCQSLGIRWARDGNYPEFAIQAIGRLRGKWARREWERDEIQAELVEIRAELADARRVARLWFRKAQERKRKLVQARAELAAVDEALDGFFCPALNENGEPCGSFYKDHGVNVMRQNLDRARSIMIARNAALTQALNERDEAEANFTMTTQSLARVRNELKDLQGANREFGRQLAAVKDSREFWYKEAQDTQAELDRVRQDAQDWRDEIQELWLSPAEAEELKKQLAKAENAHNAKRDAYRAEQRAENVEAALAGCGLTGIYTDFGGPADAIRQMVERLVQLESGEALQAERQLRREAEQRAERAEARAALVTPGLATLLGQLANSTFPSEHGNAPDIRQCVKNRKAARKLAADIREAL